MKGWPKYWYCFSCLKVRGGSLPSNKLFPLKNSIRISNMNFLKIRTIIIICVVLLTNTAVVILGTSICPNSKARMCATTLQTAVISQLWPQVVDLAQKLMSVMWTRRRAARVSLSQTQQWLSKALPTKGHVLSSFRLTSLETCPNWSLNFSSDPLWGPLPHMTQPGVGKALS